MQEQLEREAQESHIKSNSGKVDLRCGSFQGTLEQLKHEPIITKSKQYHSEYQTLSSQPHSKIQEREKKSSASNLFPQKLKSVEMTPRFNQNCILRNKDDMGYKQPPSIQKQTESIQSFCYRDDIRIQYQNENRWKHEFAFYEDPDNDRLCETEPSDFPDFVILNSNLPQFQINNRLMVKNQLMNIQQKQHSPQTMSNNHFRGNQAFFQDPNSNVMAPNYASTPGTTDISSLYQQQTNSQLQQPSHQNIQSNNIQMYLISQGASDNMVTALNHHNHNQQHQNQSGINSHQLFYNANTRKAQTFHQSGLQHAQTKNAQYKNLMTQRPYQLGNTATKKEIKQNHNDQLNKTFNHPSYYPNQNSKLKQNNMTKKPYSSNNNNNNNLSMDDDNTLNEEYMYQEDMMNAALQRHVMANMPVSNFLNEKDILQVKIDAFSNQPANNNLPVNINLITAPLTNGSNKNFFRSQKFASNQPPVMYNTQDQQQQRINSIQSSSNNIEMSIKAHRGVGVTNETQIKINNQVNIHQIMSNENQFQQIQHERSYDDIQVTETHHPLTVIIETQNTIKSSNIQIPTSFTTTHNKNPEYQNINSRAVHTEESDNEANTKPNNENYLEQYNNNHLIASYLQNDSLNDESNNPPGLTDYQQGNHPNKIGPNHTNNNLDSNAENDDININIPNITGPNNTNTYIQQDERQTNSRNFQKRNLTSDSPSLNNNFYFNPQVNSRNHSAMSNNNNNNNNSFNNSTVTGSGAQRLNSAAPTPNTLIRKYRQNDKKNPQIPTTIDTVQITSQTNNHALMMIPREGSPKIEKKTEKINYFQSENGQMSQSPSGAKQNESNNGSFIYQFQTPYSANNPRSLSANTNYQYQPQLKNNQFNMQFTNSNFNSTNINNTFNINVNSGNITSLSQNSVSPSISLASSQKPNSETLKGFPNIGKQDKNQSLALQNKSQLRDLLNETGINHSNINNTVNIASGSAMNAQSNGFLNNNLNINNKVSNQDSFKSVQTNSQLTPVSKPAISNINNANANNTSDSHASNQESVLNSVPLSNNNHIYQQNRIFYQNNSNQQKINPNSIQINNDLKNEQIDLFE